MLHVQNPVCFMNLLQNRFLHFMHVIRYPNHRFGRIIIAAFRMKPGGMPSDGRKAI